MDQPTIDPRYEYEPDDTVTLCPKCGVENLDELVDTGESCWKCGYAWQATCYDPECTDRIRCGL